MSTLVIVIVLMAVAFGYMAIKKKGSGGGIGGIINSLKEIITPPDRRTQIEKYKAQIEAEKKEQEELRLLLKTKQELSGLKSANQRLRRDIQTTNASPEAELRSKLPSAKLKH